MKCTSNDRGKTHLQVGWIWVEPDLWSYWREFCLYMFSVYCNSWLYTAFHDWVPSFLIAASSGGHRASKLLLLPFQEGVCIVSLKINCDITSGHWHFFLNGLVVLFLLLKCRNSLYIVDINLIIYTIYKYFLLFCRLPFHFFDCFFCCNKLFSLM